MSTVFKGLTRPALIRGLGVPLYPFLIMCVGVVILAANVGDFLYSGVFVGWFVIRKLTDMDERIFELLWLRSRVKGSLVTNRHYDAIHYSGNQYDSVDISKLDEHMKLDQQASIEAMIPYSSHIRDNLNITRYKDLIATWEISGAYFECRSQEDLDILTDRLNTLIRSFDDKEVTFYTHRCRNKKRVRGEFKSRIPFVNVVMRKYYGSLARTDYYHNRLFLSLCYKTLKNEEKVTAFFSGKKEKQIRKFLNEAITAMNEMTAKLDSYFERFNAVRLGVFTENNVRYSSQLSLFQYLLTGKWQKVRVTNSPFYATLGGKDLFFGNDAGQIGAGDDARYFRILEIKDYFQNTETGIFDALMYLPVEYVLTTSFTSMKKREAVKRLDDQLDKLEMTDDAAKSQMDALTVGVDMLSSGFISFGLSSFTLTVYADSPDELVANSNILTNTLQDMGLIVTNATLSLGAGFFSQLPANYTYRPRLSMISSLNFVEMECFHNFFSGKEKGNTWGNALITLKGSGNDVYHMNYHMTSEAQDFFGKNPVLGHTDILGTSNVGKTVLMMTHAYAAQQFGHPDSFPPNRKNKRLTTVFFDKDRAGEVAIRAMGGEYYRVKDGEPTGWNPFELAPTKRNIRFIKDLIRLICTLNGGKLTDYQNNVLSAAVERLMQRENRTFGISKLIPLLMENKTDESQLSGLKVRLSAWKQGGEYGWIFDNAHDSFDISDRDVFGIDGTEFLDDKVTSRVIPFYLIYKVTMLADGRRLLMYMDEFWQWLNNDAFSDFVYNKLKTGRKLDMVLVVATQSPDELIKTPIAAAVREQCATHIYLANPKGKKTEYVDGLDVPELYFDIIKGIDPLSREHLVVKNPQRKGDSTDFAAFARLDLGDAAYYLPVLSASAPQLEVFDSLYQDGMKPEDWLEPYLEQANRV